VLALGIASAPLYAVAQAADVPVGMKADHAHMAQAGQVSGDRARDPSRSGDGPLHAPWPRPSAQARLNPRWDRHA
jgi:hypothetical protein